MRRRVAVACSLALLGLAAGLVVLAGPVAHWTTVSAGNWGDPDLRIHLYRPSGEADPFASGNEITYEIYFINFSNYVADDIRISVNLPEHATYLSSSEPGLVLIQAGPDRIIWIKNHLSGFEEGWLAFTVRVNDDAASGALAETQATIDTPDRESDYSNNESLVQEYVLPAEPDLQVTKHLWQNSDPVVAGNVITYEIAVQNLGGTAANNVRLTDTLPADCAYVSDNPAGSGFGTHQVGQTVIWTTTVLAPARDSADSEILYVGCQIAPGWTPGQWLENVVEVSTPDVEAAYDNNRSRWTFKPEEDRRSSVAITSVDDRTMRLLSDGGFDYALFYLSWSDAEPQDNEYNWTILDGAVWQAWRHNVRLVVRVDRAPDWARGAGTETAPPNNPNKLGEFLQGAAARWPRLPDQPDRPQVYGYVIWNEPNLAGEWGGNAPDSAAYTALLQAAYAGVKAGSANAWVISAGLAPSGDIAGQAVDDLAYLEQIYTHGAGGHFDFLGANPMGFASAPDDASDPNGLNFGRAEDWRAIMVANGDTGKGMFGAETGWLRDTPEDLGDYNWIKVSGIEQAHYLARAAHKARCEWGDWMGPLTTWNLDFATGVYTPAHHLYWYGLVAENGQPLRAYRTLQNAARRGPADLWVEKELIDPLQPGQEFRYVIRYTNIGGQSASGVFMTDTLAAGAQYVSDSAGGVLQPAGDQVVWNLGEVTTCTYESVTLTLRLADGDSTVTHLDNRVEMKPMPGEPYVDDNVATTSHRLPDLLAIEKAVTPERVGPGQILTYTLIYSNTGDTLAANVIISDIVPQDQISALSYARSGATITPGSGLSYTWQVQDLAPGEGGTITITAVITPDLTGTHTLTNRATISTTSEDLYWPNDTWVVSSTLDGEPPLPPALASPDDGAATNSSTPLLTWKASPSPDVAGYYIDLDSTVQDVGGVTQTVTGILADGTYTWTVATYDVVSNTGPYTDVWSLIVDTDQPLPPALISPTNAVTLSTNAPTMTWGASPSPDVAGYLLDLDGAVMDVGHVTETLPGILAEGVHTWTVAAYDVAGNNSAFTGTWTFAVDTVPPPPGLVSPGDAAVISDDTPTLTWLASPCTDVGGYLLDLNGKVTDVGKVTETITGVLANETYTWTVAAYDKTGHTSAYTDTWSFSVDTGPPEPPVLLSPANLTLTDTTSLTLTWRASSSPDAAGYLLNSNGAWLDVGDTTLFASGILADGAYTWTVEAYDGAGNASVPTATWTFTIDTIPPPPVLESPPDGTITNDVTPTLTWLPSAAPDIAHYLLDISGTVQNVGNTTGYTPSILADGFYTWTVAAVDATGHTSAYTDTWSFSVDSLPPEPPALLDPTDGITITTYTATLTWQDSPSAEAAGYLLNVDGFLLDAGDATSYTLDGLSNGVYTWTAAAYDAAANTGAFTGTWSFTVDSSPVPPELLSPTDGITIADNTPTLVWAPSPSVDITGYLAGWEGVLYDVGDVTFTTTNLLADSVYTWTVAAYNGSGQISDLADLWTFAVDTTPPDAADLVSPADGTLTSTTNLTLTWQASPSAEAAGYNLDLGGVVLDVGATTEYSTGLLADGAYTWTVFVYDTVSNTRPYTDTWTFIVDTTGPLPPPLLSPVDGAVTSTTSLTLAWGSSPSADADGSLLDTAGLVLTMGAKTLHNTGVLGDGVYTWTVAAYDVLSNTGAYTSVWSYEVDTTAPEPPPLVAPADALTVTDSTPTLTWGSSPSADVVGYWLDLGGVVQDVGNVTQTATAILADGTYTWTVAAYDLVGHTSAYTGAWSFAVDTTAPPPPPLQSPRDGAIFAEVTPTLSWGASPGEGVAGYLLRFDGLEQDVGDSTRYTTTVLADGTYTWTVAAYDVLGLTGPYTDVWAFAVDTVSPAAEAVAPADGETGVGIDTPLVITFSRAIEASTFDFDVSPDPGGWLVAWGSEGTAVLTGGSTVATLTHNPFGYRRTYNVTVTAASDPLGNPLAGAPYAWSFVTAPYRLYCPLVIKAFVQAPDLVVERIVVRADDVQVVVKNQGAAMARDGFWLDVYVDPEPVPGEVNQIWPLVADEGLVWGVTRDLAPGETLMLSVGDGYFVDEYSHINWPLAASVAVYAQVDSANAETTYGTVLEGHELQGGAYNNVGGPAYLDTAGLEGAVGNPEQGEQGTGSSTGLPSR